MACGSWNNESLSRASSISVIKENQMSLRSASQVYGIPKSTLHDHLSGKVKSTKRGPPTVLTNTEERKLAEWENKIHPSTVYSTCKSDNETKTSALQIIEDSLSIATKEKFEKRFEEGYDVEEDELYNIWAKLKKTEPEDCESGDLCDTFKECLIIPKSTILHKQQRKKIHYHLIFPVMSTFQYWRTKQSKKKEKREKNRNARKNEKQKGCKKRKRKTNKRKNQESKRLKVKINVQCVAVNLTMIHGFAVTPVMYGTMCNAQIFPSMTI